MKTNYVSPHRTSRQTKSIGLSIHARLLTLLTKISFHQDTPLVHRLGRAGERYVKGILEQEGMRVLSQNWRTGRLELDLVFAEPASRSIVFVEVKTRQVKVEQATNRHNGISLLAEEQEARLIEAAGRYLERYSLLLKRLQVREYRLELMGVVGMQEGANWRMEVVSREVIVRGLVRR
jgi:Holliday junction resolvase-like predicted endonuclease